MVEQNIEYVGPAGGPRLTLHSFNIQPLPFYINVNAIGSLVLVALQIINSASCTFKAMLFSCLYLFCFRHLCHFAFAYHGEPFFHSSGWLECDQQAGIALIYLGKRMRNAPGPKYTITCFGLIGLLTYFYQKRTFQYIPPFILIIMIV
jgi:hypothetical protein